MANAQRISKCERSTFEPIPRLAHYFCQLYSHKPLSIVSTRKCITILDTNVVRSLYFGGVIVT